MLKTSFRTALYATIIGVIALIALQIIWIHRIQQEEIQKLSKQFFLILSDALKIEAYESQWEYNSSLIKKGYKNPILYSGNMNNLSISIYYKIPLKNKVTKKCMDLSEWHKYNNDERLDYMVNGINLSRLDSVYSSLLRDNNLLYGKHYINLINTSDGSVLETTDSTMHSHNVATDTLTLGLFDTEALVACFDLPPSLVYQQIKQISIISLIIVVLLLIILRLLLKTIFVQINIARIREEITSMMVHEIKNPIIYIDKVLSMLEFEPGQQQQKKCAQAKIQSLFIKMEQWLITTSRNPKWMLDREEINLKEFLISYINEFRELSESTEQTLNISLDYKLNSDKILADKMHLPNAVHNLIDNAIKYSANKPLIKIECFEKNDCIHIAVSDQGVGIPKSCVSLIFTRGYRVPEKQSVKRLGFGLGLSYVRLVAKAYGGKVTLKSRYGEGSRFCIIIPKA
ncbi:MAG: HAMP domain-containing sensor histidine kinase [Bacteroidales bacterium]|nr:HAMP domain-containing sensor histidine kinase [Bacteroidales bacterium]